MVYCPRCSHLLEVEKHNRSRFYMCTACRWCELTVAPPKARPRGRS